MCIGYRLRPPSPGSLRAKRRMLRIQSTDEHIPLQIALNAVVLDCEKREKHADGEIMMLFLVLMTCLLLLIIVGVGCCAACGLLAESWAVGENNFDAKIS